MQHELRGQDVDVELIHLDLGEALPHLGHPLIPVGHGDGDSVGLGGRGQLAAAPLSLFEGEAQDPVDAGPGHHRLLDDGLAVGALEHLAADAGVLAFGVLADHQEVDVTGLAAAQRAGDPGQQLHRAQVDVLVEAAAELQQRVPQGDVVRDDVGPAHCAEVDRVEAAQHLEPVLGQHPAVLGPVLGGGEVELLGLQTEPEALGRPAQDLQAFRHHLSADPVSCDHGDAVGPARAAECVHRCGLLRLIGLMRA